MGRSKTSRWTVRAVPVLLALGMAVSAQEASLRAQDPFKAAELEKQMLDQVNRAREKEGVAALRWNDKLKQSALAHVERLKTLKRLSHQLPDEPDLLARVASTGLRFDSAAENLAKATVSEDLHPGLMDSPGHRANILSSAYNSIGIAIVQDSSGYYAVQNFAHVTIEYSSEVAERRLTESLVKFSGRKSLKVSSSRGVRQAICEMAAKDDLDPSKLPTDQHSHSATAYTAVEPEELPDEVKSLVTRPGNPAIEVGVCYRATARYPGGIYWVGIVY